MKTGISSIRVSSVGSNTEAIVCNTSSAAARNVQKAEIGIAAQMANSGVPGLRNNKPGNHGAICYKLDEKRPTCRQSTGIRRS